MIAVDTNIFIYHLEDYPTYGPLATRFFEKVEAGEVKAMASIVTYAEILVIPERKGESGLAQKYRILLKQFPHLSFYPIHFEVADQAAWLRGKYPHIKLMDALILATAIHHKAEFLLTQDTTLSLPHLPIQIKKLSQII